MFKKFLAGLAVLACATTAWGEAEIKFCESFDNSYNPVGLSDTFTGLQFSCFAIFDKEIGKNKIVVSLYKNNPEDNTQSFYTRSTSDVNPRWDSIGILYQQLPEYGSYTMSFELEDGSPLATGNFTLKEPQEGEAVQEVKETEFYGTTLEGLFKKYSGFEKSK